MIMDLATPLGRAGQALGAGAGALLGTVGDVLSAPRRGLMNLLGLPETGSGLLHQVTGMDEESPLTRALGMGVEMLTDPLTFLGGSVGRLGAKALAPGLERAAIARGPQFAGGIEKLGGAENALAKQLAEHPQVGRVLEEIPQGSQLMANSNNALAYHTPEGDVLRISQGASRPLVPEVLQPTRNVEIGPYRVERLPFAESIGDPDVYRRGYQEISQGMRSQGLFPTDLHPQNVGLHQGRPVLIEAQRVPLPGRGGENIPLAPAVQARQPGRVTSWLLDQLGV